MDSTPFQFNPLLYPTMTSDKEQSQRNSVATLAQEDPMYLPPTPSKGKSRAFYMSFLAICVTTFLSALDLTAVGTALPTIADALNDTKGDFTWVGSAYALLSTAFIPLSGSLADAFGRRPILLISIAFFAVGSALAGASQNMATRAVQGIGGGGILALSEILVADLVPLAERGIYQGLVGLVWSFASSIGPLIVLWPTQATAHDGWLFYLNLPLAGLAFLLVTCYLSVKRPEGTIRSKLAQVDWIGNALVIVGSALAIIGLTWGGIRYPWESAQVLAPLIIGLCLLVVFGVYEAKFPGHPTIPLDVIGNRTSLSGLLATAVHAITSIAVIYYLPLWISSPLHSSPPQWPSSASAAITISKKYRPTNYLSWAIIIVGLGVLSTLRENSSTGKWVGYQIILGVGMGMLFSAPVFPILAPLPNNRSGVGAGPLHFHACLLPGMGHHHRKYSLAGMSRVLSPSHFSDQPRTNSYEKLPAEFVSRFPPGFEIAYIAIPVIRQLQEPLKQEVQAAFALSMATIWQEIAMDTTVDDTYALKEDRTKIDDAEK
ncbi:MFS domain-containing protein [Mycena indigotica]|uniref:MFS domain-containing protein n=1 Tax=Mycena indigotica TaxID=2126181 RepID=A0A8H6W173_9AGAR|nr:MFS domain-containing protein [Mycena indigotica]KAF7301232.1 MFS domain-containing protein [Mycena indigotica]